MDISQLCKDEIGALDNLTHSAKNGYMKMYLKFCRSARLRFAKKDFVCEVFYEVIDNQIVGWCIAQNLLYRYEDYLEFSIYVAPEFRGKGVGGRLIDKVIKELPNHKISVWVDNPQNEALFKKYQGTNLHAFDSKVYSEKKEYELFKFS